MIFTGTAGGHLAGCPFCTEIFSQGLEAAPQSRNHGGSSSSGPYPASRSGKLGFGSEPDKKRLFVAIEVPRSVSTHNSGQYGFQLLAQWGATLSPPKGWQEGSTDASNRLAAHPFREPDDRKI